ncbi:HET-domain-containing protein [Ophiobolus disseminans]|uniref:HET-domain-containing protein n=1 Tax=Ophiobolus disseminans TaxID=1469910 RepID=A0A6A6ZJX1_9PLEO|nr:HET-domain-containing protein [Ophiobolus disseminans]
MFLVAHGHWSLAATTPHRSSHLLAKRHVHIRSNEGIPAPIKSTLKGMEFCTSCKTLEIRLASFLSRPGTDNNPRLNDPVVSLGRLNLIRYRYKSCPLCRLVFAVFQSGPLEHIAKISNLANVAVFAKWINALGPSTAERLRSPSTYILLWAECASIPSGRYKVVIRAVSTLLPNQPHFGRISPVQTSFLDYTQIRSWLQHCEGNHGVCASTAGAKPTKHFFVIDVRNMCIVEPQEPCRYVALSYVWGGVSQYMLTEDNLDELQTKGGIQEKHLVPTIRDAIIFTEKLGERYLWVDVLCIIQDSKMIRQQTLQDMGNIYAHSLLTVIAGSCSSANDHLPGVSKERCWTQWFQKVSAGLTLSAHFDFKDILEHTKYGERAWTFQEYQLANRLLVFAANNQVYFSCKEVVFSEEVVTGTTLESDAAMLQGAELIKIRPDQRLLWSRYREAVETYTARQLSNEGDAIDAFSGLLHTLHNGKCIEGIPKPIFEVAFLWQARERIYRRKEFPSWTWAGWKGRVHWLGVEAGKDLEEEGVSETEAIAARAKASTWIVWHSSSVKNCRTPAFKIDGPPVLLGTAPDSALQEKRFPGLPRNVAPTPTLMPDRLTTSNKMSQDLRYLQFWTVSMRFRIELETTAVLRYTSLEAENTGNGLRRFILHKTAGRQCGWVLLDERWIEKVVSGSVGLQEFILLSEASRDTPGDASEEREQHNRREYNAMMIIWQGELAERAGLGQVTTNASMVGEMEWKEILLG